MSGIQPTGLPHLGNYLGALKQWVSLQHSAPANSTLFYSIVDLHAITLRQDPAQLREWRKQTLAVLLACGLQPGRNKTKDGGNREVVVFYQSDVPQHAELMWILSCTAGMGYLARMTHWKVRKPHAARCA